MSSNSDNEQYLLYMAHNHIFSKAASNKMISLSMPINVDYGHFNKSVMKDK